MAVIFYASSVPGEDIPSLFPFQDIVFHLLIYSLLAFLFSRALRSTSPGLAASKIIFSAILFAVTYGISDEWHQGFISGRTVSGFDVFIDGIGSVVGSIVYPWLR
jgi:VanZ family protein